MPFMNGIERVTAGGTAQAQAVFILPLTPTQVTGSQITWELIDWDGVVWNGGPAGNLQSQPIPALPGQYRHVADATIRIPDNIPTNQQGTRYQIRWTLATPANGTQYMFDSFTVLPAVYRKLGPSNTVEVYGNIAEALLTLPQQFSNVSFEIYYQNARIFGPAPAQNQGNPFNTADGWVYCGKFDSAQLVARGCCPGPSLDPYMVLWRYNNQNPPLRVSDNQEIGNIFLCTPTMLSAFQEVVQFLNQAYIESGIDPGTEFKPEAVFNYLRMGRDLFNAAVMPTQFTMTNAESSMRAFWLTYSTVYACRSQYISEGMKAFNFGGQVVQLDVDRTQYWDQLATTLEQTIQEHIRPFKINLWKRGALGGDGSGLLALRFGAIGSAGITVSPISPFRGNYGFPSGFGPFLK